MDQEFEFKKLEKKLRSNIVSAIYEYNMLEDNDRVMVCLSGGKDSYTLLDILLQIKRYIPIKFDIVAMNIDQGHPNFPKETLPQYLSSIGVEYKIVEEDTHKIVKEKVPEGKTTCGLCSRLRRGITYRVANELKANKIALGHHRDDAIETVFLNLFYGGKLKGMAPKLLSDSGENIIIRPLIYCSESSIIRYAKIKQFPIIPCDLCGSQENLQRQVIKEMLSTWNKKHPGRTETIFRALQNVELTHLMDREKFDFINLKAYGQQTNSICDTEIKFNIEA